MSVLIGKSTVYGAKVVVRIFSGSEAQCEEQAEFYRGNTDYDYEDLEVV